MTYCEPGSSTIGQAAQVGADESPERQDLRDGRRRRVRRRRVGGRGRRLQAAWREDLRAPTRSSRSGPCRTTIAQHVLAECESGFEVLDPDFRLRAVRSDESERKNVDRRGAVVEEAFVAVADLLDVECLVADSLGDLGASGFHLDRE